MDYACTLPTLREYCEHIGLTLPPSPNHYLDWIYQHFQRDLLNVKFQFDHNMLKLRTATRYIPVKKGFRKREHGLIYKLDANHNRLKKDIELKISALNIQIRNALDSINDNIPRTYGSCNLPLVRLSGKPTSDTSDH